MDERLHKGFHHTEDNRLGREEATLKIQKKTEERQDAAGAAGRVKCNVYELYTDIHAGHKLVSQCFQA